MARRRHRTEGFCRALQVLIDNKAVVEVRP